MCQIFGYSSSKKIKLNSLLREFYSHSDRHPNGWGLALLDGIHANVERETLQASKSNYLEERFTEDISAPVVLAHIRRATIGNVELRNCHPFTGFDSDGRRWTLIHNGTIFDFRPMHEYVKKQKGETDSERILLYLIDMINDARDKKGSPLTDKERFSVLEENIKAMSKGNKLNLLIYDGELLYAHTNLYGSLYYHQGNSMILFSTVPLTKGTIFDGGEKVGWIGMNESDWEQRPGEKKLSKNDWSKVPAATLFAYKRAHLKYQGSEHENLYVEDPKDIEKLYLSYANL